MVVAFREQDCLDHHEVVPIDLSIVDAFLFYLFLLLMLLLLLVFHPLRPLICALQDMIFILHVMFKFSDALLLGGGVVDPFGSQQDGVLVN